MNCMRCGKETDDSQIFCGDCLAQMDQYPVKPGTVVQIPVQPEKKQAHHRRAVLTHEEQIRRLTRINRRLILAVILTTALAVFSLLISFDVLEQASVHKLLGQNYSVVTDSESPSYTGADQKVN